MNKMNQKHLVELFEKLDTYCLHLEIASCVALVMVAVCLVLTCRDESSAGADRCATCGRARRPPPSD